MKHFKLLRDTYRNWQCYDLYDQFHSQKSWSWVLPQPVRFCWELICQGRFRLVCYFRGHNWEDHGYAGPESGCIDMVCNRCGESHHCSLY